jgi:hypothetical protein
MPTPKQMGEPAIAGPAARNAPTSRPVGPADDLPPEYWDVLLREAGADALPPGLSILTLKLSEIAHHVLRVSCRRCRRIVEIQKADAVRLYGPKSVWKNVAQRLLDNTCQQRTGRHEEDGCWPSYDLR